MVGRLGLQEGSEGFVNGIKGLEALSLNTGDTTNGGGKIEKENRDPLQEVQKVFERVFSAEKFKTKFVENLLGGTRSRKSKEEFAATFYKELERRVLESKEVGVFTGDDLEFEIRDFLYKLDPLSIDCKEFGFLSGDVEKIDKAIKYTCNPENDVEITLSAVPVSSGSTELVIDSESRAEVSVVQDVPTLREELAENEEVSVELFEKFNAAFDEVNDIFVAYDDRIEQEIDKFSEKEVARYNSAVNRWNRLIKVNVDDQGKDFQKDMIALRDELTLVIDLLFPKKVDEIKEKEPQTETVEIPIMVTSKGVVLDGPFAAVPEKMDASGRVKVFLHGEVKRIIGELAEKGEKVNDKPIIAIVNDVEIDEFVRELEVMPGKLAKMLNKLNAINETVTEDAQFALNGAQEGTLIAAIKSIYAKKENTFVTEVAQQPLNVSMAAERETSSESVDEHDEYLKKFLIKIENASKNVEEMSRADFVKTYGTKIKPEYISIDFRVLFEKVKEDLDNQHDKLHDAVETLRVVNLIEEANDPNSPMKLVVVDGVQSYRVPKNPEKNERIFIDEKRAEILLKASEMELDKFENDPEYKPFLDHFSGKVARKNALDTLVLQYLTVNIAEFFKCSVEVAEESALEILMNKK